MEYDGTDFSGWQVQPGRRTVQGAVEEALARIVGARVPVLAAGRTDAGVHALGQGISFRAATRIPAPDLARALNALLPPDAAVLDLDDAPPRFHATRDAAGKVYRYEILCGGPRRPSLRRTAWWIPRRLDAAAMRRASRCLVGRRDFASFRTNPGVAGERQSTVRTLRRLDVRRTPSGVVLEFEGDGFLYNMVRSLVGTLVQVGRGTWPGSRVADALAARDRRAAGPTAPPQGLTLVSVAWRKPGGGRKNGPRPRSARRIAGRREAKRGRRGRATTREVTR
jgi:tRNA pseudouridine38-40 synthase